MDGPLVSAAWQQVKQSLTTRNRDSVKACHSSSGSSFFLIQSKPIIYIEKLIQGVPRQIPLKRPKVTILIILGVWQVPHFSGSSPQLLQVPSYIIVISGRLLNSGRFISNLDRFWKNCQFHLLWKLPEQNHHFWPPKQ